MAEREGRVATPSATARSSGTAHGRARRTSSLHGKHLPGPRDTPEPPRGQPPVQRACRAIDIVPGTASHGAGHCCVLRLPVPQRFEGFPWTISLRFSQSVGHLSWSRNSHHSSSVSRLTTEPSAAISGSESAASVGCHTGSSEVFIASSIAPPTTAVSTSIVVRTSFMQLIRRNGHGTSLCRVLFPQSVSRPPAHTYRLTRHPCVARNKELTFFRP